MNFADCVPGVPESAHVCLLARQFQMRIDGAQRRCVGHQIFWRDATTAVDLHVEMTNVFLKGKKRLRPVRLQPCDKISKVEKNRHDIVSLVL